MIKQKSFLVLIILCLSLAIQYQLFSNAIKKVKAALNQSATIRWDGNKIQLEYEGQIICEAEIKNIDSKTDFHKMVHENDNVVNQVIKWTSRKKPLKLVGQIFGSEESFPCESDRKREGPDLVRHSVGLSHSLLNRAVYDRNLDWVLSADFPSQVEIIPEKSSNNTNTFKIIITGRDIIIRFRPYFYQKHRGLTYFQPWTYQVWKKPVVGWCSWFAYLQDITEQKIKRTAEVISEILIPYGFEYLQIDNGYQRQNTGLPEEKEYLVFEF